MDWIYKISDFFKSIGDFLLLVWKDEDRWWLIGGMVFFFIAFLLYIVRPLYLWISDWGTPSYSAPLKRNKVGTPSTAQSSIRTVTIKGVYQMNGPKSFSRKITIAPSETGYYSQLMGNKSKQAQWIRANFPGADTDRGFSISINIK